MLNKEFNNKIVFGYCTDGPFRYAVSLLKNPQVNWLPWSYHFHNIHHNVIEDLKSKTNYKSWKVYFTSWKLNYIGETYPIRSGRIDYLNCYNNILRMTVFLDRLDQLEKLKFKVNSSDILCFFLKQNDIKLR